MLTRLDAWLGLRVFHPPVILLCWLLRCTQHRLHRDMWFLFVLYGAWSAAAHGAGWLTMTIYLAMAAYALLIAAVVPQDAPGGSMRWFRLFLIAWMLLTDLPLAVFAGRWWEPLETMWVLVAEYAVTIASLPPPPSLRIRRRRRAVA